MECHSYCPANEDCSVYLNEVKHNEIAGFTYRTLYCQQGNNKFKICKRYQAYITLGKQVTNKVLPNSVYTLEEIAQL